MYEDGVLVVKWVLEHDVEMKGQASAKIRSVISDSRREGEL